MADPPDLRRSGPRSILITGLVLAMVGGTGPAAWAGGPRSGAPAPATTGAGDATGVGDFTAVFREHDFADNAALAAAAHHLVILDLEGRPPRVRPSGKGPSLRDNLARYRLDAGTYTFCLDEEERHLVRMIVEDETGKRILRLDRHGHGSVRSRAGSRRPCEQVTLPSGVYHLRVSHHSRHIGDQGRVAFIQPGSAAPLLSDDAGTPLGGFWALRLTLSMSPGRRPGRLIAPPPTRSVPSSPGAAIRPLVADFASQSIDDAGLFTFADPRDPLVGSTQGQVFHLNLAPFSQDQQNGVTSGFWTAFADATGGQTVFQATLPLVVTDLGQYKASLGVPRADGGLADLFLHGTIFSTSTLMLNYDQPRPDPAPPAQMDVLFRFFADGTQIGELQAGEVALFQECNYRGKAAVFAADTPDLPAVSSAVVTLDKTAASVRLGNDTGVFLNTGIAFTGTRQLVTVDTPCLAQTPIGNGTTSSLSIKPLFPLILASSRKCEKCRLVGVDLSGLDLSGVDLEDADLSQANLQGANLTKTNFQGANLSQAKLAGTTLQGVVLMGAILDGAAGLAGRDLSQLDLSHASLRQVDLSDVTLFGARLDHANLEGTNLYRAFLANNVGGNITESASLVQAHLKNVNLSFAELSGVDFTLANFYGDNPSGNGTCNTASPNYAGFTKTCAAAHSATVTGTTFEGAYLYGVDFTNAAGVGVSFSESVLVGTNFASAQFSASPETGARTTFFRAFLQGANFVGATLKDVDMSRCLRRFQSGRQHHLHSLEWSQS